MEKRRLKYDARHKAGHTVLAARFDLIKTGSRAREAVPELVHVLLQDQDAVTLALAAEALLEIGNPGGLAVQALIQATQDVSFRVRIAAAMALGVVGRDAPEAVDALLASIRDPIPGVRLAGAMAFSEMGPVRAGAVPVLAGMLVDPDVGTAEAAALALGFIGSAARHAVGPLGKAAQRRRELLPAAFLAIVRILQDRPRSANPGQLGSSPENP